MIVREKLLYDFRQYIIYRISNKFTEKMSSVYSNNNLLQKDFVQDSCNSLPTYSNLKESKNRDISGSSSIDMDQDEIEFLTNGSTHKSSILRSGIKSHLRNRKDSYGVIITPDIKQHKIKFKEVVKEVKVVDNWKEYNIVEEKPCCICNLF